MLRFVLALCWGSFLNMLAYRLVHDVNFLRARSFCPCCNDIISFYDNIPVISWILLRGKCKTCSAPISILYPFIELSTAFLLVALHNTVPSHYFWPYALFFSALIVTIRTDLETMLISRFMTLILIPIGFLFSWLGYIPLSLKSSLIGSGVGYSILWSIASIFYLITKKEGMGKGDMELMAFIGSFTGLAGCWTTLLIASITGSIVGMLSLAITRSRMIPFGPFLSLSAMSYILFKPFLIQLLFNSI